MAGGAGSAYSQSRIGTISARPTAMRVAAKREYEMRLCTRRILSVSAVFLAVAAHGATTYRPSSFPLTFETLPSVDCHPYSEFLRRPELQGAITKEQRSLMELFCPLA